MLSIQQSKKIWTYIIFTAFMLLIVSFPAAGDSINAPSNLKVLCSPPGNLAPQIKWQDNATGEIEFEIERSGGGSPKTAKVAANITEYNDKVNADHTYTYRVRAIGSGSNSEWSDSAVWSSRPLEPSNLTAKLSITQSNYIDLAWQNNSKINPSFVISKANDSGTFLKSIKIPAGNYSYKDMEVFDNIAYQYTCQAESGDEKSYQSNIVLVTVLARPTNLTLNCFPGTFNPQLNWQDHSNSETGFIVERAIEGQKSNFDQFSVAANTTHYVDTVKPDTLYYYQVRAVCNNGGSVNSNAVVWSSAPTQPFNLQAYSTAGDQVKLTWQDTSKTETQFLIGRYTSKEISLLKVPANSTSYIDSTVTPGITYKYNIAADNESSKTQSAFTDQVSVIPLAAPTGLKEKITSPSIASVTLEWKGVLPSDGNYMIEKKIPGGAFAVLAGAGGPIFIDTQVEPGTTYYYRVRVKTVNATSNYTDELKVNTHGAAVNNSAIKTIAVLPIAAPTGLKAKANATSVALEWKGALPNGAHYELERKVPSGQNAFMDLAAPSAPQHVDTDVKPGTNYIYRVRIRTANAYSNFSEEIKVSTPIQANSIMKATPVRNKPKNR